jgi:TetR/AcrR family transcriptional regulator, tetracycline repressor protein
MTARKPRPRAGLTREKILDAGIAFVDEHGVAALSTRRLGATLGVQGMTLYYYVPSKTALLDGMVERLLQRSAGEMLPGPDAPWPDAMRVMARALRATLLAHPGMLTVIATRPVNTPESIRLLESGLAVLRGQGVPLGLAMDIINAVTTFVIGHTLAEVGQTPGHERTEPDSEPPTVDPAAYPNFAEALATGAGLDFGARFALVLDVLMTGFTATAKAATDG